MLIQNRRSFKRRLYLTEALIADESESIKVIWFNQPFLTKNLKVGDQVSISGKTSFTQGQIAFISPQYEKIYGGKNYGDNLIHTAGLIPNYHLTDGLTQKQLRYFIKQVLNLRNEIVDWLPKEIIRDFKLLDLKTALKKIHAPQNNNDIEIARRRLAFSELFLRQLKSQLIKKELSTQQASPLIFKEKEIFVQYGYTKNERQTQLLTKNYGSLSPFSIKSANIQGFGDCAIFLSDKKRLCIANLNGVVEIGDNVQDRLDTIALADEPVALIPTRHSARAGISDDGYYVLGYSDYALNAAPFHFNKAICVNIKDGLAITEWMSHTENTPTGYSDLPFFRFAEKGLIVATLDYKVASLSMNNDTDSNYAGTVNKFVPTRIKTRNENCGDTRFFKDWYFALITVLKKNKDTTPVFFPIKITQEIDYDLTKYEIDPVNNLPPVVYKEAVETGSASETMTYLFEIQHSIVGSGQQTCIVIENYLPATAYDVIELFGIKLLFNKVNAA